MASQVESEVERFEGIILLLLRLNYLYDLESFQLLKIAVSFILTDKGFNIIKSEKTQKALLCAERMKEWMDYHKDEAGVFAYKIVSSMLC